MSFVIPAFNEERFIGQALHAIQEMVPENIDFEIIVVDHGSSDKTREIAEKIGAKVIVQGSGTIASLRNEGVKVSKGDILIFLDADVLLTDEWGQNLDKALFAIEKEPNVITGSWYGVSKNPSWIERVWFKPLLTGKNTHINSGHLIISRQTFLRLGGFDERLETGEDYEFSMRGRRHGLRIFDDQSLPVSHEGYPKTIAQFVKREIWHGKSDFVSLRNVARSKVAVMAIIFVLCHILTLACLITARFDAAVFGAMAIVVVCLAASVKKYRHAGVGNIIANTMIYYVYFLARAFSLLAALSYRSPKKRVRA